MKGKGIFIVAVLLLAVIVLGFQYWRGDESDTNAQKKQIQQDKEAAELLIVAPQTPTDKIIVESVTLQKDGFLVARQMDDGKLSQIIEISQPLKKGTHKNIPINLGSVDIADKELIVMIYEDYSNDSVFNDLDMPVLNEEGLMTARYVKTGKALPASIMEADDPSKTAMMNMPGMRAMVKVRYTDKGFVPDKIEINAGDMVEFINESSTDMWVASMPHPAHTKLPTFDQFRLYKKGGVYRYIFEKKGTWEYHDHINPARGGVVTVQ